MNWRRFVDAGNFGSGGELLI